MPLRLLVSFFRLPGRLRVMAVEAAVRLVLARLLVGRVPMRRWAGRSAEGDAPGPTAQALGREVGRMVRRVARRLPARFACLPQAVAAHRMLRRRGVPSRLVFGVRRPAPGQRPRYHAWVTVDGACVIGGRALDTYAPLCARPPGAASGRRRSSMLPAPCLTAAPQAEE